MAHKNRAQFLTDLTFIVDELAKKTPNFELICDLCLRHTLPFVKNAEEMMGLLLTELQSKRFNREDLNLRGKNG